MPGNRMTLSVSSQSIGRALDILLCFATEESELGATELAQHLRLHKSTAHRIASFLVSRGFLVQNPLTAKYRLGLKLVELGSLALRQIDLRQEARLHLKELAERMEESAFLAVRDGDVGVYVDIVEGPRLINITAYVGRRTPLHCTGTGKALLAWLTEPEIDRIIQSAGLRRYTVRTLTDPGALKEHLTEIRAQGYAIDNEESQEGLIGVAVPIIDGSGKVIASLSLAGPSARLGPRLPEIVDGVKEAAQAVSRAFGGQVSIPVGASADQ